MKNSLKTMTLSMLLSFSAIAYEPSEGQPAPDFEITQLDGTPFKLSDYRGKQSVYVVFWNTWCHYCLKKIPKLKGIQENLADDIKIIAINTSRKDSVTESLNFENYFKTNYALAFDHGEKVTDLYNVHGVPTEFIIDINGIIKHRDGVPAKLENYLQEWNDLPSAHTQVFRAYLNIFTAIALKIQQAS